MDPLALTAVLSSLPLAAATKVAHAILDSLNRRRTPSRDILETVDGPDEVDRVTEIATKVVQRIESDEGKPLSELSSSAIKRYSEVILAAADDKARHDLPAADESRARIMLESFRKEPSRSY